MSKELAREIRKELSDYDNDQLFSAIEITRQLKRHPWATTEDIEHCELRLVVAEQILVSRLREALKAPQSETPLSELPEQQELLGNQTPEIDYEESVVHDYLKFSERRLEQALAQTEAKLRHPHTIADSEAYRVLKQQANNIREALRRKKN